MSTSKGFEQGKPDWSPSAPAADEHVVFTLESVPGLEVVKMPAEAKSGAVEALLLRRRDIRIELAHVEREIITVKQDMARLEDQLDNLTQTQRQAA